MPNWVCTKLSKFKLPLTSFQSMVNFLLDPTGDIPWEEESGAEDVVHVESPKSFYKMLRKQKQPMLVMFYAPCEYLFQYNLFHSCSCVSEEQQTILFHWCYSCKPEIYVHVLYDKPCIWTCSSVLFYWIFRVWIL